MMNIKNTIAISIAALTFFATTNPASAAAAAGAGIQLNDKYVAGYSTTWNGESREDLTKKLSKQYITFERDFEIPVDEKDPTTATIKGKIRIFSYIRGDKEVMATTAVLKLVKRKGKWYVETKSLQKALKKANQ